MILLILVLVRCGTGSNNNAQLTADSSKPAIDTFYRDTPLLKETYNEKDIVVNEFLVARLRPIRDNFARINAINHWSTAIKKDLEETTEGGEAVFYYLDGRLEKIATRHFGETFQQLTEFYLLNGQLSFVFEKSYKYNRPMYYDSTAMKENNDNQVFDLEKSTIIENRSYFENGKLIHQVNNEDDGASFAEKYLLGEQKRIKEDFDKLMQLIPIK